jgi:RNA polymerase sigma-70 factor (family 1)
LIEKLAFAMTDTPKNLEQNLIQGLQAGHEDAFTTIYKKYWYKMFLVAYRKLQYKEIAEELVQDIFTRLWKERANLHIVSLDYYLFSAVRFEVIDHIRVRGSQNEYLDYYQAFSSFEDSNTENTIAFNDLVKTIDEGLDSLPKKSKEIFKLRWLEHWSVSKIALHLQLSEKAVEYHLTKATKSIRIYLKEALISILPLLSALLC